MNTESIKMADLDALRIKARTKPSSETTIFLHGAGANMHDLVPLADYLPSLSNQDLYFLNAPFTMLPSHPMYIWFNVGELVERMASGFKEEVVKTFVPTRIDEGRKHLTDALSEIVENYDKINLIGFSQGGMMAFDYALNCAKIGKVALLSTSICDYPNLTQEVNKLKKDVKIFQSHGTLDPILPLIYGTYLRDFIKKMGTMLNITSLQMDTQSQPES